MLPSFQDSLPLVTVVTPSYNQAQFLGDSIRSVISQDYPRIEYMVLDGGSADGSVEIIQGWAHAIDFWISRSDAGQADAINRGWQRSHGEILAWLNSDDTYQPGAVAAVVEIFQRHPQADVVTGDCQVIDRDRQASMAVGRGFVRHLRHGRRQPSAGCEDLAEHAGGALRYPDRGLCPGGRRKAGGE